MTDVKFRRICWPSTSLWQAWASSIHPNFHLKFLYDTKALAMPCHFDYYSEKLSGFNSWISCTIMFLLNNAFTVAAAEHLPDFFYIFVSLRLNPPKKVTLECPVRGHLNRGCQFSNIIFICSTIKIQNWKKIQSWRFPE
jgi:hypothetical protein